jgi:cytochrome c-type biogenesis protein CcmH/NrfF
MASLIRSHRHRFQIRSFETKERIMTLEQQIYELQTELRCCELTCSERKQSEIELARMLRKKARRDQENAGWKPEIPT